MDLHLELILELFECLFQIGQPFFKDGLLSRGRTHRGHDGVEAVGGSRPEEKGKFTRGEEMQAWINRGSKDKRRSRDSLDREEGEVVVQFFMVVDGRNFYSYFPCH